MSILTERDAPSLVELLTRASSVAPTSHREEDRSFEAVIATNRVVPVFDKASNEVIDEVLVPSGFSAPVSVPFLENHRRGELDDQLGSVSDFVIGRTNVVARIRFAEAIEGDEISQRNERAYQKVRDGHARSVSAGYVVERATVIQPGRSAYVDGQQYKAGSRKLRIATKWFTREVSLTPVAADSEATIRNFNTETEGAMPQELRDYLESLGMERSANDADAWNYYHGLVEVQRSYADGLIGEGVEIPAREEGSTTPTTPATPEPVSPVTRTAPALTTPEADPVEVARQAVANERQRVSELRNLFGSDAPEVLERSIVDGLTVAEASPALLEAIRSRPASVSGGGPGIHSSGHEQDCTLRTLQAGLMVREGLALDHAAISGGGQAIAAMGLPAWMSRSVNDDERARVMELGHRYSALSLVDFCRESLRLSTRGAIPMDPVDVVQRAFSTSEFTDIFSTNVNAQLLAGYEDTTDSTIGWCSEADVADFKTNERTATTKFGRLKRHARGGTAEHLATADEKEEYKIGRYTGQYVVDEMDIIDDRMGAIDQLSPMDMGSAARQLRPDIVYAILLANEDMRDSVALFHAATHGNLETGALAAATLQATLTSMGKQRIAGRPINVSGAFLIVPVDLKFDAQVLLRSASRDHDGTDGNYNPLASEGLNLRSDDRIGVAGVTDPRDDTVRVGTATNYFVAANPGAGGARTIEVGYRRGTGRVPRVRSKVLDSGTWGMQWDVSHDIGAKALDWRGLQKSTGV